MMISHVTSLAGQYCLFGALRFVTGEGTHGKKAYRFVRGQGPHGKKHLDL